VARTRRTRPGVQYSIITSLKSFLIASLTLAIAALANAQSAIVAGVSQIGDLTSTFGPIYPNTAGWNSIAGGSSTYSFPNTLVIARAYGSGRVIALGNGAPLYHPEEYDNKKFMLNAITWLDSALKKHVLYTTGHSEWGQGGTIAPAVTALNQAGFTIAPLNGTITTASLAGTSVLWIGNAWSSFTSAEIEVVRQFVNGGGGLILDGLGWSWQQANAVGLDGYPMNVVAAPYGARWLPQYVSDSAATNSEPIYHVFYPNVGDESVGGAIATINSAHSTYGSNLPAQLESNATLRNNFIQAHESLGLVDWDTATDPARQQVFDYLLGLIKGVNGTYYRRNFSYDTSLYPTMAWLRESVWTILPSVKPLTPASKQTLETAGAITGARKTLFDDYSLFVLDNNRFDETQLSALHHVEAILPPGLQTLHQMEVSGRLGMPLQPITLVSSAPSQNIAENPVGSHPNNFFPSDIAPWQTDEFTDYAAYSFNYAVSDYYTLHPDVNQERDALVADAGNDHLNYLYSIEDGGFAGDPGFLLPATTTEYFSNTAHTLALGIQRFNGGRHQPLEQFLWIVKLYSLYTPYSRGYLLDSKGNLSAYWIPLTRSSVGQILTIQMPDYKYTFTYGLDGHVSSFKTTVYPSVLSFSPASVVGGNNAVATVTISSPAPAGGVAVSLMSSGSLATVPATVAISAGSLRASFNVSTSGVASSSTVTVKATYLGVSTSSVLTVLPASLTSVAASAGSVKAGQSVSFFVHLNGFAGSGAVVSLASSDASLVVPATVTVAPGGSYASFAVTTKSPTATKLVTVTATYKGVSRSTAVQVSK
jgi:hypothetical protein